MNKIVNGEVVAMTEEEIVAYENDIAEMAIEKEQLERQLKLSESISMAQLRLVLLSSNLLTQVQTYIYNSSDEALKIVWEYATKIKRDNEFFTAVASQLALTDEEIDNMYLSALEISVD